MHRRLAATRTWRPSWWRLEAERAKRRHVGHLPSGGDQGFELALPNPCVFGVMDHRYDEGRMRTGCTSSLVSL